MKKSLELIDRLDKIAKTPVAKLVVSDNNTMHTITVTVTSIECKPSSNEEHIPRMTIMEILGLVADQMIEAISSIEFLCELYKEAYYMFGKGELKACEELIKHIEDNMSEDQYVHKGNLNQN